MTTYPVDGRQGIRAEAAAWEAAFLALARDELVSMAAAANLSLSFGAERSVQDELQREVCGWVGTIAAFSIFFLLCFSIFFFLCATSLAASPQHAHAYIHMHVVFQSSIHVCRGGMGNVTFMHKTHTAHVATSFPLQSGADVSTVVLSYAAMLAYIAVAMARFPSDMRPLGMLVHTRAALGLAGMGIVVGAVGGALGLLGWVGLSSTLIIMEVIPFLVLAVGVDNMFILSHALHRQNRYYCKTNAGTCVVVAGNSRRLLVFNELSH